MDNFSFSTVTSRNYIHHTVGLFLNLQEIYPHYDFHVATSDQWSYETLKKFNYDNFKVYSASDIWEPLSWTDLKNKTTQAERAFATKAAFCNFILEQGHKSTLMMDSDLFFTEQIDDIIEKIKNHSVTLMPGRHGIKNWRKSQRFGVFSAGMIGFNQEAKESTNLWKELCFNECFNYVYDGVSYEQKYLDYFLGEHNAEIILDEGLNVSATVWNRAKPTKVNNQWKVSSGDTIRVFHASRTTDKDNELSKLKMEIDNKAIQKLGYSNLSEFYQETNDHITPIRILKKLITLKIEILVKVWKFFHYLEKRLLN